MNMLGVIAAVEAILDQEDWQIGAPCGETDPEAFFPEKGKGGNVKEVKKICQSCDVQARCLEYALEKGEKFGIWGGLTERQRRGLRRTA